MNRRSPLAIAVAFVTTAASGCALYQGEDDDDGCPPHDACRIDPAGLHHQYIVDWIGLPSTASMANDFGFNLDGDEQGRPDNALGQILSVLIAVTGAEDEVDDEIQSRIDAGELIQLIDVQTTSTVHANGVGVELFLGSDPDGDPADNWPGPERYEIRDAGAVLVGEVRDTVVSASHGDMPLEIALPNVSTALRFDVRAAHIEAWFDGERLHGTLGGAIPEDEARAAYIPAFHLAVLYVIERDCPGGDCIEESTGQQALDFFDENDDGEVTEDEVADSSLLTSLFAPDVDMFDEDGELAPRSDGIKESLSIGIGFTAAPAEIAAR